MCIFPSQVCSLQRAFPHYIFPRREFSHRKFLVYTFSRGINFLRHAFSRRACFHITLDVPSPRQVFLIADFFIAYPFIFRIRCFLLFTFLFFFFPPAIYLPYVSCTYSTSIFFDIAFSLFFSTRIYFLPNFYLSSLVSPLVVTCFLNANLSICSSLHAFPCARYESSAASARSTSGKAERRRRWRNGEGQRTRATRK